MNDFANHQFGANVVYNDTPTREMYFLINGKNSSKWGMKLTTARCVGPCLATVVSVATENKTRMWSDATQWPNKTVPKEGDDVIIPPGQNWIFDLVESPLYNYIEINGVVTFKQDAAILHLRAKYVFIRAGELHIGNQTNPFPGNAKITLSGEMANQEIVIQNAVEAGNKILANVGLISIYGTHKISRTRLTKTVNALDSTINV